MRNLHFLQITKFFIILCSFVLLPLHVHAQAPTTPASNLTILDLDGDRFRVNFTRGDGARRIIIAKAGSPVTAVPVEGTDYLSGAFGAGNQIIPGEFVVYKGTSNVAVITGLTHSTTYHFKIFEFNGSDFSTQYLTSSFLEGNQATLTNPTVQSSAITFENVLGSTMRVNWTNGNGSGRILIARANNPVNVEPQDLMNYNSSGGGYGSPTYQIGTGNYVLYSGNATGVNISNLEPNTTYHFALYEYNGGYGRVYLTSTSATNSAAAAMASQGTNAYPTENANTMTFNYIDGTSFSYYMNSNQNGNGQKRLVIIKEGSPVTAVPVDGNEYTGHNTFGNGHELAPGEFVVFSGTSISRNLIGLQPHTTYYFKVYEYNGSGTNTYYLKTNDSHANPVFETSQSTVGYPTTQASNITFSDVLGSNMRVNWTRGDGSGRILIARANSAVNVEPQDLISYNSTSGGYGSSTYEIGTGNYVLYAGNGTGVNITNLEPGTTYHFALYEYNGNSGRVYLTSSSATNPTLGATGSQATSAYPTINANAMSFNYIDGNSFSYYMNSNQSGNGQKRLVIAKQGSPVTAVPVDGNEYTDHNTFGSGHELAPNEFVVFSGTNISRNLVGLQPHTTYYFKVFEYNGSGTESFYLTASDSNANPVFETSQATVTTPTTQASNITFSDVLGSNMRANWTRGDGSGRILIARAGSAVNVEPQDLVNYNNTGGGYGSSTYEIGTGNYVLYAGNGTGVNITNLEPGTTYHFALYEYNGNSGRVYLTSTSASNPAPGATASQSTNAYPTENSNSMTFNYIDGNSFAYYMNSNQSGNGQKRLVIAKQGSPVTAVPVDGNEYTGHNTFGSGHELAPNEFVVFSGASISRNLSGLQPHTTYYFKVYEYNGSGTNTYYLVTNDAHDNPVYETTQATISYPSVQTGNIFINSKTTTSFNINWTNGDGTNRILIARANEPVNIEPVDLINYNFNRAGYGIPSFEIGSGNYVLYAGNGVSANVSNLQAGTNYHFALFEYNGSSGRAYLRPGYTFEAETYGERPTTQVSNVRFEELGATSMRVKFTRGNGSSRLVIAKEGQPVDVQPSDLTSYTADGSFGQGQNVGANNFVVYNGTNEEFQLSNLKQATNYHFAFFEYAINQDNETYLTPGIAASQATPNPPTVIASDFSYTRPCDSDLILNWTSGNGQGRLVILSESPLNTAPTNGTDYTANFGYGLGDAIGNGYVIYNAAGNLVPPNLLKASTNYYVNIYEYNGTKIDPIFNMTPLQGFIGDITAPSVSCKNIEVVLDASGNATITAEDVGTIPAGDCGTITSAIDISSFDCSNLGPNNVTLTITDSDGNSSSCVSIVTVVDRTAPTIITKNITIQLDANGTATIDQDAVNDDSTDACGPLTFSTDRTAFNSSHVGENTVTLTVTDGSNNSSSATAIVTVEDGCLQPTDLLVDVILVSSVEIQWTAGKDETNWIVKYSNLPNFNPETEGLSKTVADSPSTELIGLSPNTSYQFYIKADCGNGEESNFAGPIAFTTHCIGSPTLSFLGKGEFENNIVTPTKGTPETTYNFAVVYTNEEGTLPPYGFPRVVLDYEGNGRFTDANDRSVVLSPADENDTNTRDGKVYIGSINQLPSGTTWQAWVQAQTVGCATEIGPFDVPKVLIASDLEIFANDIVFDNPNPDVSSPLQITATIHNRSDFSAENFVVHLRNQFDMTAVYDDITIDHLGPQQSTSVVWNIITPAEESWNPMEVFVDYTNVIVETNELNNRAIRPFTNGDFNLPGAIEVQASASPSVVQLPSDNHNITISGYAKYIDTAVELENPSVAGATVSFTNPITGNQVQIHTNARGYFSFQTFHGTNLGTYSASVEVTDFTLSGKDNVTWDVIQGPCLPDLSTRITPSSRSILEGESASGQILVTNRGCAPVASETLLQINQTGGLPLINDIVIPILQPGESYSHDFTVEFNSEGTYYITALADANYIIEESSENNNLGSTTIRVLPLKADIQPSDSVLTCVTGSNQSFTIRNAGHVATGAFENTIEVFLDGSLLETLNRSVQNLDPGQSVPVSIPFEYQQTGSYSFVVSCDVNDTVEEISETNNIRSFSRECKSDLYVKTDCGSLMVDPIDPVHPGTVTYSAIVGNKGNVLAQAPIEFEFTLSNGEVYALVHNQDILPGNEVIFTSDPVSTVSSEGIILKATVDPNGLIDDRNLNNNSIENNLCWEFRPIPRGSYDFWNRIYNENETAQISIGLEAKHLYRASSVTMRFEVSGPGINGWILLGDVAVQDVAENCRGSYNAVLPTPFVFSETGTYSFRMTSDPNNEYNECNEENNVLIRDVTVGNKPDMRILSQYINPTLLNPDPGQSIFFHVSYENIGYSNIDEHMNLTLIIDNDEHAVVNNVPGLMKNRTNTIAIPIPYASEIEGLHMARAIIDSNENIDDRNRLNNEASRSFVVGAAANLHFNQFSTSSETPEIGEMITIEAHIANNGELDVDADVLFSYVSATGDTIAIGTKPVKTIIGNNRPSTSHSGKSEQRNAGQNGTHETISMPWIVMENPVKILGEIINPTELEFDYTDNFASVQLNTYNVTLVANPSCEDRLGSLTVQADNGKAPYTYNWSNGFIGEVLEAQSGTYGVIVIDATGREAVAIGVIEEDSDCAIQSCSLSAVSFDVPSSCNPSTGVYATTVVVAYENVPTQGSISVNGTIYPVTESPQSFEVDFYSGPVIFNIHFTEDDSCNLTIPTGITLNECAPDCEGTYGGSILPGTACKDTNGDSGILDENCLCDVDLTAPDNDDLCDAIQVTLGATSTGGAYSNVGATVQSDEPRGSCWSGTSALQTVWFRFEAPTSGDVTVTTDILGGTLSNTHIAIYEAATDCNDLTTLGDQIHCNEDNGNRGNRSSSLQALTGLTPGAIYYIQVAGMNSQNGTFGIEVTEGTLSVDMYETDYGIQLYPNPTQSGVAVYVTAGVFRGHKVNLSITDVLGKVVYSTSKQFETRQIAIQPSYPLESGVYFVHLKEGDRSVNKRLIVK